MNPDVKVLTYDTRLGATTSWNMHRRYDVIVDGNRQLPDALPRE